MQLRLVDLSLREVFAHTSQGKFGRIIRSAEMSQPEPAHTIRPPCAKYGIGGLCIREMARIAQNALLEMLRIGSTQKAFAVMIRFQDEQVRLCEML